MHLKFLSYITDDFDPVKNGGNLSEIKQENETFAFLKDRPVMSTVSLLTLLLYVPEAMPGQRALTLGTISYL